MTKLLEKAFEEASHLSEEKQDALAERVLNFARSTEEARWGTAGKELLRFAGVIEQEDLRTMTQAIEEGCERVDSDEW